MFRWEKIGGHRIKQRKKRIGFEWLILNEQPMLDLKEIVYNTYMNPKLTNRTPAAGTDSNNTLQCITSTMLTDFSFSLLFAKFSHFVRIFRSWHVEFVPRDIN